MFKHHLNTVENIYTNIHPLSIYMFTLSLFNIALTVA